MSFQASVLGASEVYVYKEMRGILPDSNLSRPRAVEEMHTCILVYVTLDIAFHFHSCRKCPGVGQVFWRHVSLFKSWRTPPCPPHRPLDLCLPYLPFQDFTSSQSWSVESSTSDSPTSIAIIKEMSESLLTAGSCSPARRKQSSW